MQLSRLSDVGIARPARTQRAARTMGAWTSAPLGQKRGQMPSAIEPAVNSAAVVEEAQAAKQAGLPYRVSDTTITDIQNLLKSQTYEYDYEVEDAWVEGEIPKELQGTFFRNGPGMQVANERYKRHTFDGDGMILSFAFDGGRCHFRNRFVRTKSFLEEQAAGRPLYRGAFTKGSADGSLLFNPFDLTMKNAANTGVLQWGKCLFALYESGLPHELKPATLDTVGESTVDGQLITPQLGAHYRIEKRPDGSRRWVTFSNNAGASGTKIIFYEFEESGKAVVTLPIVLKGSPISMIHDLAITENYYVIVQGPVNFNAFKFATQYAFSRCSIVECLVYDESQPTKVHIVPRPGGAAAGEPIRVLEAPASFSFHHANAYELPGNRLVLDTAAWEKVNFASSQHNLTTKYYEGGSRVHLRRWAWDMESGQLLGNNQLLRRTMEFPSVNWAVNGRPHRHTYCTGDAVDHEFHWGPSQAIVKVTTFPEAGASAGYLFDASKDVNVDVWTAGERHIVNEPIFVPRPGGAEEDDGWLLVTVHDAVADKGQLVILDARSPSKGPVATITLPHFLPAALHGSFSSEVFGATSDAAPRWAEPNKVRAL